MGIQCASQRFAAVRPPVFPPSTLTPAHVASCPSLQAGEDAAPHTRVTVVSLLCVGESSAKANLFIEVSCAGMYVALRAYARIDFSLSRRRAVSTRRHLHTARPKESIGVQRNGISCRQYRCHHRCVTRILCNRLVARLHARFLTARRRPRRHYRVSRHSVLHAGNQCGFFGTPRGLGLATAITPPPSGGTSSSASAALAEGIV
jgi:hypothetical protein